MTKVGLFGRVLGCFGGVLGCILMIYYGCGGVLWGPGWAKRGILMICVKRVNIYSKVCSYTAVRVSYYVGVRGVILSYVSFIYNIVQY